MTRRSRCFASAAALVAVFVLAGTSSSAWAQDDHEAHHPEEKEGGAAPAGKQGGMGMGDMGEMMKKMGVPPPTELYPSLMALPDLPLERRAEIQAQAHARMKEGARRLSEGLERLGLAAPGDDFEAMRRAVETMREGLGLFQSGLAAHQALADGKPPRIVAMKWFKSELNLLDADPNAASTGPLGLGWFHFFVMTALITFMALMLWMYFHKMRRASTLLAGLAAPPEPAAGGGNPNPARAPTGGKWSGRMRIACVFDEAVDIKTFRLVPPEGSDVPFRFSPGQFLTLSIEIGPTTAKRSYTISSSPTTRRYVEITVKREPQGVVSRHLHDVARVDDLLELTAPAGKFTFTGTEASSLLLVGGGVGITPLVSVIRYLTDVAWPGDIALLHSCRTPGEYAFREELEFLQRRHGNLTVHTTMTGPPEPDWRGPYGRLTAEFIASNVDRLGERRIHLCGPVPMMEAVKEMLTALGVPADHVRTEAFGSAGRASVAATSELTGARGDGPVHAVRFVRSDKTARLSPDQTILDAADDVGVEIENSCRAGTCGSCKVKLIGGRVEMDVDDALDPTEKSEGWILACQAHVGSDVDVDA